MINISFKNVYNIKKFNILKIFVYLFPLSSPIGRFEILNLESDWHDKGFLLSVSQVNLCLTSV